MHSFILIAFKVRIYCVPYLLTSGYNPALLAHLIRIFQCFQVEFAEIVLHNFADLINTTTKRMHAIRPHPHVRFEPNAYLPTLKRVCTIIRLCAYLPVWAYAALRSILFAERAFA